MHSLLDASLLFSWGVVLQRAATYSAAIRIFAALSLSAPVLSVWVTLTELPIAQARGNMGKGKVTASKLTTATA